MGVSVNRHASPSQREIMAATNAFFDNAIERQLAAANSSTKCGRSYQLFLMLTSPGGRFFDHWEFGRECVESILQILSINEYASNGVDRSFLVGDYAPTPSCGRTDLSYRAGTSKAGRARDGGSRKEPTMEAA